MMTLAFVLACACTGNVALAQTAKNAPVKQECCEQVSNCDKAKAGHCDKAKAECANGTKAGERPCCKAKKACCKKGKTGQCQNVPCEKVKTTDANNNKDNKKK